MFPVLGILLSVVFPFELFSQCSGSQPALTVSYDTVLYGVGNNSYAISFPKFNPALGTLLSADITSGAAVKFGFVAVNTSFLTQSLKVRISREDDISSSALTNDISALTQSAQISKIVSGAAFYSYGPAYMNHTTTTSVTNGDLINFEGVGNVDFDYETQMTVTLTGSLAFNLSFTAVQDTTHFNVTYRYCPASLLSSDLLFFTAIRQTDNKVLLNWRQATVDADRVYSVQVSTDGQIFSPLADIKENAAGAYDYTYFNGSSKKLYFRIAEKNASGEIKYSNIRVIEFNDGTNNSVSIFPTLYTGGALQVSFPQRGNWQVIMYSADGRRVSESHETNVYNAQLELPSMLGNGIYTAEVINMQTQQRQSTRIIVKR